MLVSVQPKDNRMYNRLSSNEKALIEKAANYLGESASKFVTKSALEKAKETIREHELMQLNEIDSQAFLEALSAPIAPNTKLLNALKEHSNRVTSR